MTETQPPTAPPVPPAGSKASSAKAGLGNGAKGSLLVAVAAFVAMGWFLTHPMHIDSYFKVHGGFELDKATDFQISGSQCSGASDYQDLKVGAPVTITDDQGNQLNDGTVTGSEIITNAQNTEACVLIFDVSQVRSGEKGYGIDISGHGLVGGYTEQEMKAGPMMQADD